MSNNRMMWIQAITPVHVGCGFGVGAVDLPVIREKATNWPVLPGSGIKGVLADYFGASEPEQREKITQAAFGKPDKIGENAAPSNAGALVIGDARMVAFPVRSLYGTWAWITCPLALQRLQRLLRDLEETGLAGKLGESMAKPGANQILVPDEARTKIRVNPNTPAYLADLDLAVAGDGRVKAWADSLASWLFGTSGWAAEFVARFGVVHEDLFNYLLESGTEIATRIHVDPKTGSVAKGQLWTEEALPAETVMASLVWADKVRVPGSRHTPQEILNEFCGAPLNLQIGGKATVGRGRVRTVFGGA